MKLIQKNKFKIIIICIVSLILITSSYSIIRLLFPNLNTPIYGNRTKGIEKVRINDTKKTTITNNLKGVSGVKKASINIGGTLIRIIIDVNSSVDVNAAKNIGVKALTEFTTEEKDFYDIQVYITQNDNSNNNLFPIIGYKQKYSSNLVWTGK